MPVSLTRVSALFAWAFIFVEALLLGMAFWSIGVSCATTKTRMDARKLFFASIIYLPALLGVMMFDRM
jgi:heme O synthase-like polyprenyltransferase